MAGQSRIAVTILLTIAAFVAGYYLWQPRRTGPMLAAGTTVSFDRNAGSSDASPGSGSAAGDDTPSATPGNPLRSSAAQGDTEATPVAQATARPAPRDNVPTLRFDGNPDTAAGINLPLPGNRTSTGNNTSASAGQDASVPRSLPRPELLRYTIVSGDTLESIAKRLYGSTAYWQAIAWENPTLDARRLRVGQAINLPREATLERVRSQIAGESSEPAAPAPQDDQQYTVQPGDTLSHISQRFYQTPNRWRLIFNANRKVLPRPEALRPGMTLRIPPEVASQ